MIASGRARTTVRIASGPGLYRFLRVSRRHRIRRAIINLIRDRWGQCGNSRQHASLTPVHAPCSPWSTCRCAVMMTFDTSVSSWLVEIRRPEHERLAHERRENRSGWRHRGNRRPTGALLGSRFHDARLQQTRDTTCMAAMKNQTCADHRLTPGGRFRRGLGPYRLVRDPIPGSAIDSTVCTSGYDRIEMKAGGMMWMHARPPWLRLGYGAAPVSLCNREIEQP